MDTDSLSIEWSQTDSEGLVRVIPTDSFREGVGLVAKIADLADKHNYQPNVKLQSKKVTIWLFDEDESDITEADIDFARQLDELLAE